MMPTRARPPMPNFTTIPATMMTKAPVGPPIWVRDPPKSGDDESGDNRGVKTNLGRHARGDGEGHGEGQGDQADGDAGDEVMGEVVEGVAAQAGDGAGQPLTRGIHLVLAVGFAELSMASSMPRDSLRWAWK